MTVSSSTAGPYFSTGSISFSALRNTFRLDNITGTIKASELRRNDNVDETNPVVPDATENSAISTNTNLSLSQFRNSIKYYWITQTGFDQSISLESDSYWNGNLGKNIVKNTYVNGTNGDNDLNRATIRHRGDRRTTRNLTITVNGEIYGCKGWGGGRGYIDGVGGQYIIDGTRGGVAFRLEGSGSGNKVLKVVIGPNAKVWAGGGGGEKGKNGANGSNGVCRTTTLTSGCGSAPGCPAGYSYSSSSTGGCCSFRVNRKGKRRCRANYVYNYCYRDYAVAGGIGGEGGAGGYGRGWDNFNGSLEGNNGAPGGARQTCGGDITVVPATNGSAGEKGGTGGEWGRGGGSTNNAGNGGIAGAALFGNNFTLEGSINSSTVKGYISYTFIPYGAYETNISF